MQHLFANMVRTERMSLTVHDGVPQMAWTPVPGGERVKCRLDLNFVRPGKDIAPAPVAGKAPDRIGLMFLMADWVGRAGDRVVAIPDDRGQMPIQGTFEIRVIPDIVMGFASNHHMEVQILETNQNLVDAWPDDEEIVP